MRWRPDMCPPISPGWRPSAREEARRAPVRSSFRSSIFQARRITLGFTSCWLPKKGEWRRAPCWEPMAVSRLPGPPSAAGRAMHRRPPAAGTRKMEVWMPMTTNKPIIDPQIRSEIEALVVEHAWRLDHHQSGSLAELYTDDGRLLGIGPDRIGREA